MHATLTDDAEAYGYAGCEPFGPNEDYDPMYEGFGDRPKCGGSSLNEYDQREGCPGCRHCDPVDPECQPYGWGVERFESDAALRLARELRATSLIITGRQLDRDDPCESQRLALKWTGFNFRLEACAERLWNRLCDVCKTHGEAVAHYTRWANKATAKS
jgi:hypothetical protein